MERKGFSLVGLPTHLVSEDNFTCEKQKMKTLSMEIIVCLEDSLTSWRLELQVMSRTHQPIHKSLSQMGLLTIKNSVCESLGQLSARKPHRAVTLNYIHVINMCSDVAVSRPDKHLNVHVLRAWNNLCLCAYSVLLLLKWTVNHPWAIQTSYYRTEYNLRLALIRF